MKSAVDTDRWWDGTDLGKKEHKIRGTIRKLDRMSSAIKTQIEVKQSEARNLM